MNGNGSEVLRPVGAYALGVWIALTVWAALAEYVLPGRGQALGKLGSFHWVFLINLLPALLCAAGFTAGLFARRLRAEALTTTGGMAVVLGLLFPLTLGLLRPVFAAVGNGLWPALVWCVAGSAITGLLGIWAAGKGSRP